MFLVYTFFSFFTKFNKTKNNKAGSTQPKLFSARGIILLIPVKFSLGIIKPKKSVMLKIKVIKTTPLKTSFVAYLSGTIFSKISTIVIGYKNINAGTANVIIKST